MKQSEIIDTTKNTIIDRAEGVISRELTETEKALIEYAIDQIRLGLV